MNRWPQLSLARRAEPFGNAAVEGLLAQQLVIASRVQGLTEVIVDGVTGRLVAPQDAVALAGVIAEMLDDQPKAHQIAAAGLMDAQLRFSLPRYRLRLVEIMNGLLESGR